MNWSWCHIALSHRKAQTTNSTMAIRLPSRFIALVIWDWDKPPRQKKLYGLQAIREV